MARTYISQVPPSSTCEIEYCGSVYKYFCVQCKHWTVDCRHNPGVCKCTTSAFWASPGAGERPVVTARLLMSCPECREYRPDDERVAAGMKCRFCAYTV